MAAPVPKPKEERRNRVPPQRGEWVDLEPLEAPILPELPDGEWDDDVRRIWAAWRADPVTAEYAPADIDYALESISLRQQQGLVKSAAEFRRRSDALGLTPKGKRDLRWRIPGAVAQTKPKNRRPARSRAHLTAV